MIIYEEDLDAVAEYRKNIPLYKCPDWMDIYRNENYVKRSVIKCLGYSKKLHF